MGISHIKLSWIFYSYFLSSVIVTAWVQQQPLLRRLKPSSTPRSLLYTTNDDLETTETTETAPTNNSNDSSSFKVTVFGGTGFVGSRVCKFLVDKGESIKVTSVSKTGTIPNWCKDEDWVNQVVWNKADLLQQKDDSSSTLLDEAVGKPDVVVSCIGEIGTDSEKLKKGNGDANCLAFESAKRGGNVKRAVFVSVGSEVIKCQENWLPGFFGGYFDGKEMAEKAALDAVNSDSSCACIVKPTFIYGGDSFNFLPPRVTVEYGSFIEELLSLSLFKFLADNTPGLIKVALRPPSSVNAVAEACASAAVGGNAMGKILDGTADINDVTSQPPATGLTDALMWTKEKASDIYELAKVEVPKAIESTKASIEKLQK